MTWLLVLAGYFTGAFPTSYLAGRLARGIDLRQHGSGNLGATNVIRVLGWKAATPVFMIDIFKGFAPTFFFPRLDGSPRWEWALAYGAAAIVGHVYSVYVRFKGGKGVATSAGVFLALAPWALLAALVVWLTLVATTRIVLPRSKVRLSAGRTRLSREAQALCFFAGANSIFYGNKLLTAKNPETDADRELLAELGLAPQAPFSEAPLPVAAKSVLPQAV